MNVPGKYTTTMQSSANSSQNFPLKESLKNDVLLLQQTQNLFYNFVFKLKFRMFSVMKYVRNFIPTYVGMKSGPHTFFIHDPGRGQW
jgi:hypothetical protein